MIKYTRLVVGVLGAALSFNVFAWIASGNGGSYYGHGGYGRGGYYHSDYYRGYYYNGWAAHGVIVGVPAGAYYGHDCAHIWRCDRYHRNCVTEYICE